MLKKIFCKLLHLPGNLINIFIREHPLLLINLLYGNDFWKFREACISKRSKWKEVLYFSYLQYYGSWVGLGAIFETIPMFPHGLNGIFISNGAHIGKNCVIFHQVTIGSNMTAGSKRNGSPTVHDNVYIGCGAKIIGKCDIGDNVRIGANCIVTKDIPRNSTCIIAGERIITTSENRDNGWIRND